MGPQLPPPRLYTAGLSNRSAQREAIKFVVFILYAVTGLHINCTETIVVSNSAANV